MKPSTFYDLAIAAGAAANLLVHGDYFKIMAATSPVTIRSDFGELKDLIAGQGLEDTPFSYLTIVNTSGSTNTVRVFIGDEKFIDGMSGAVAISSNAAARDAFTHTTATVTTTAANAIAAGTRDFLLIQNKSASGTIWVNFGGTATQANGLRILPGQSWETGISCPQGAVSCIGDIASNPDVLIISGA